MDRGSFQTIPVSAQSSLHEAAPLVRGIRQFGTPALLPPSRGALPAQGVPRAFDPFAFTQDQRQLTTAAIDDPTDGGGSGSLAYRAACAQRQQRAHVAAQSCEPTSKSVVLDFDSNQSNVALFRSGASDVTTLAVAESYVGEMSMQLPSKICNIRANRLLYAQIPSYELLTRAAGATADLQTQPIVANAAPPGCDEDQYALTITEQFTIDARNQLVNLLPEASIAMPKTLTAVASLLRLRRSAVELLFPAGGRHGSGAKRLDCPYYVVTTKCQNDYLPGLLFYLLLGGGQSIKKQQFPSKKDKPEKEPCCADPENPKHHCVKEKDSACSSSSSSSSGEEDDDERGKEDGEKSTSYCCDASACDDSDAEESIIVGKRRIRLDDPLRAGAPSPLFEVVEIIDGSRFLARIVGTAASVPPTFNAFTTARCMHGVQQHASSVFTSGPCRGACGPQCSLCKIVAQEFLWFDPMTASTDDSEYCGFYFSALYRIDSTAMCGHCPAEPCNHVRGGRGECTSCRGTAGCCDNTCVLREASCGGAVAYITPPTSPCQLAAFVDFVAQQVREFLICQYQAQQEENAFCNAPQLSAIVDVSCVGYEPQTDTYIVKRHGGGFVRWRSLLNTTVSGDTTAINYPFRRRAMFASELNSAVKQRYINAVFEGFQWFVVKKGVNDCFCFEIGVGGGLDDEKTRISVCLAPGCYRPKSLAIAIATAMNSALCTKDGQERGVVEERAQKYQFSVHYSLHPLDALSQYSAQVALYSRSRCCTTTGERGRAQGCPSFPPCRNEPYQVQAFAFTFANEAGEPFSLLFGSSPGFAALVDFEARCYQDCTRFVSRVLAPLDCLCCDPSEQNGACCASGRSDSVAGCANVSACAIGADCAPCSRRRYEAFIDAQCGFTTITQVPPGAIECSVLPPNPDCDCDRGDCVWMLCRTNCCSSATSSPAPLFSSSAAAKNNNSIDDDDDDEDGQDSKNQARIDGKQGEEEEEADATYICAGCCNATCFPLCVGDVAWFEAKPPVCARCKELRFDACECFRGTGDEGAEQKRPPLVGAVVLCVIQNPRNPCEHYVSVHVDVASIVSTRMFASRVGFNLHLHPVLPPLESDKPNVDSNQRLSSQKSPLARWLGFSIPFTRMACRSYTSNGPGETVIDTRIVLVIPQLATTGLSEQRENHYQQFTPFNNILTETYNVLTLDRARGTYVYNTETAGAPLGYGLGSTLVPPVSVLAAPTSSMQTTPQYITFQLYRTDGTPYLTGGQALVVSLQIIYC